MKFWQSVFLKKIKGKDKNKGKGNFKLETKILNHICQISFLKV